MHELPQSHFGDNGGHIVFMITNICYAHLASVRFDHSVWINYDHLYIYIYIKSKLHEHPNFMTKIFSQKRTNCQLKTVNFISYPKVAGSLKYGFNFFGFGASQLMNQVPNSIYSAPPAKHFKTDMLKSWQVINCTCSVYK